MQWLPNGLPLEEAHPIFDIIGDGEAVHGVFKLGAWGIRAFEKGVLIDTAKSIGATWRAASNKVVGFFDRNVVNDGAVGSMYRSATSNIPIEKVGTIPEVKFKLWYNYLSKRGVRFEIGTEKAYQLLANKNANGLFIEKLVDLETNSFERTIYLLEHPTPSAFYEEGLHALDSLKGRPQRMVLNNKEIDAYEYRAKQILLNASPKRFQYEEFRMLEEQIELVKNNQYGM